MATPPSQEAPGAQRRSRRNLGWLVVLLVGAVVWIIGAAITAATNDDILVPTLILVGSFLMPLCMVMFALTREGEDRIPHDKILLAFLLGGSVAVVGSGLPGGQAVALLHGDLPHGRSHRGADEGPGPGGGGLAHDHPSTP